MVGSVLKYPSKRGAPCLERYPQRQSVRDAKVTIFPRFPEGGSDQPLAGAAGTRPLRILLSAYACEPDRGSEPGIGWQWAVALAQAGHEVWTLTRSNNRRAIESTLVAERLPNLHFVYYDLPRWARWWKLPGRAVRLYYSLWQWGAYRVARRLCRDVSFDVAHHITFGVFRHPSFMAFLGLPFVFGPVGGGETAPRALRGTFPLRGIVIDLIRDLANWAVRVDPVMAAVYRRTTITLCKTAETLRRVPRGYRDKCMLHLEVGVDDSHPIPPGRTPRDDGRFHVLYVGRLVYWKGLHLGLMAFAKLRQTRPDARLTVIGKGPDGAWLHALAKRLGIEDAISWIPRMDHAAVMQTYARHDAFLFPSLHDSSGNAVLEALQSGLPVVCLNVGGPAMLVDPSCGFRVAPDQPLQVVLGLARALERLAADPQLTRTMGEAAMRRARTHFSWRTQVARMERLYATVCGIAAPGSLQREQDA